MGGTAACSRENNSLRSCFSLRFREIAGSLEAALTDVLEDAPGNFLKVTNDRLSLSELSRLTKSSWGPQYPGGTFTFSYLPLS